MSKSKVIIPFMKNLVLQQENRKELRNHMDLFFSPLTQLTNKKALSFLPIQPTRKSLVEEAVP